MEKTEFLILTQQGSGVIIMYRGEMDITQWWLETTSERLEDWDFQGAPDMDGIFVVSTEIGYTRGGDIAIESEQWQLANATDIRSFGISLADAKEV